MWSFLEKGTITNTKWNTKKDNYNKNPLGIGIRHTTSNDTTYHRNEKDKIRIDQINELFNRFCLPKRKNYLSRGVFYEKHIEKKHRRIIQTECLNWKSLRFLEI